MNQTYPAEAQQTQQAQVAGMATNCRAGSAQAERSVHREVRSLAEGAMHVEQQLTVLKDRLGPVLNDHPRPTEDEKAEEADCPCGLSRALRECHGTIERTSRLVDDLLTDLEL